METGSLVLTLTSALCKLITVTSTLSVPTHHRDLTHALVTQVSQYSSGSAKFNDYKVYLTPPPPQMTHKSTFLNIMLQVGVEMASHVLTSTSAPRARTTVTSTLSAPTHHQGPTRVPVMQVGFHWANCAHTTFCSQHTKSSVGEAFRTGGAQAHL